MADTEIVRLVVLLYDVCKDVLIRLFETRCLNCKLSDKVLQTYVEKHKDRLREHLRKTHCHKCENRSTCIDLRPEAFQSFSISKVKSTERNQMHVNDLQVWNLQYLLLAGDLQTEEHKLILGLYNQRNNISKQLTLQLDIDESPYNEIWETSTNYIIDIYRAMKKTSVETVLSTMFEYVKRSSHAEEVWCNLEAEFGNKDPYPLGVSTEERANINPTHGIFQIGNNNTVVNEGPSIQQVKTLVKDLKETKNDLGYLIATLIDKVIILTTITNDKETESQCLKLEFDKDRVLKSDEHFENIKRLQNTTLNPNGEPIEILKVDKGSLIIEAKVAFCTTDVALLMKAVKEILHHVMEICQTPIQTDIVLKVDLKVGPPYMGAFSQSRQSSTSVKCLKQIFEKDHEKRLSDVETKYGRMVPTPKEQQTQTEDHENFEEGRLVQSGIQSPALPKLRKDTRSETLSTSSETQQVTRYPVARSVSSPDIIHMMDCAADDSGETKEKSQTRLGQKRPKKGGKIKSGVKTNIKNEPSKWPALIREMLSKLEKLLSWRTRPKRDDLVSEGRIISTLFGSKLSDVCRRGTDNLNVPLFVRECIDAIEKRGFDSINMYIQSNKTAEVVSLRNKIEQDDYDLDSASMNIQELTGILLLFFEELKEPLLPSHLSKILLLNESQRISKLKRLLDELPVENSDTLDYLCRHLKRVLEHGEENGTTVQSIVETVAPSLMYTVDTGMRDSKWLSDCKAVSPSTASDILSICLVEYEHIFVETSQ